MIALSVIAMFSGQTSVQHRVMLQYSNQFFSDIFLPADINCLCTAAPSSPEVFELLLSAFDLDTAVFTNAYFNCSIYSF